LPAVAREVPAVFALANVAVNAATMHVATKIR
jgi:hypothetical protein